MNRTFNLTTTKFVDINAFHLSGSSGLYKMDWHQVWVVGGYVWIRYVVDGCGQLDGCGWFWSVCSCGMSVVLGGVWLEGCVWLMGVDGYEVWVVVESVWLEGHGWSQGCN